jgi:hypothetical protein
MGSVTLGDGLANIPVHARHAGASCAWVAWNRSVLPAYVGSAVTVTICHRWNGGDNWSIQLPNDPKRGGSVHQ